MAKTFKTAPVYHKKFKEAKSGRFAKKESKQATNREASWVRLYLRPACVISGAELSLSVEEKNQLQALFDYAEGLVSPHRFRLELNFTTPIDKFAYNGYDLKQKQADRNTFRNLKKVFEKLANRNIVMNYDNSLLQAPIVIILEGDVLADNLALLVYLKEAIKTVNRSRHPNNHNKVDEIIEVGLEVWRDEVVSEDVSGFLPNSKNVKLVKGSNSSRAKIVDTRDGLEIDATIRMEQIPKKSLYKRCGCCPSSYESSTNPLPDNYLRQAKEQYNSGMELE